MYTYIYIYSNTPQLETAHNYQRAIVSRGRPQPCPRAGEGGALHGCQAEVPAVAREVGAPEVEDERFRVRGGSAGPVRSGAEWGGMAVPEDVEEGWWSPREDEMAPWRAGTEGGRAVMAPEGMEAGRGVASRDHGREEGTGSLRGGKWQRLERRFGGSSVGGCW